MTRRLQLGLLFVNMVCGACASAAGPAQIPQIPQNLDFRQGETGQAPPQWYIPETAKQAGYSVELRDQGCEPSRACAVILAPAGPNRNQKDDTLAQTNSGAIYKGKTVRLRAWLRNGGGEGGAQRMGAQLRGAQLWMRVNRPKQAMSWFDDMADLPVRATEWTRSEIVIAVGQDAESIEFGVSSIGGGTVWLRDVSVDVRPNDAESYDPPFFPDNLTFSNGDPGGQPPGWKVNPASVGYKAVSTRAGCRIGPSCGVLIAPLVRPTEGFGALMQTVNAVAYRGKKVRLRAWVLLEPSAQEDKARLWIQDQKSMLYREIRDTTWTACEIIRTIEPGTSTIGFGLMLLGSGSARIDGVEFEVIPETHAPSTSASSEPKSSEPAPSQHQPPDVVSEAVTLKTPMLPSSSTPSVDEQRRIINQAARIAQAWTAELPNFICTQTIRRSQNRSNKGWKAADILTIQLGSSDGTEYHKLIAINKHPTKASYRDVKGAFSEGEFGGVLSEIFRPGSAQFHWDRAMVLRGHPVDVFRYEIEFANSNLHLDFNSRFRSSRIVSHHGFAYIARDTGKVLRIIQIAEIPGDFPMRSSKATLDYDFNDVGGREYLLLLKAELLLEAYSTQYRKRD